MSDWNKLYSIHDRIERILNTSHVVRVDDMSIYPVKGVKTFKVEIYVECVDGSLFRDSDVYTLEEAAEMERGITNICKHHNISYNE